MRKRNLSLTTTATVWDTGKHREVILEFSPSAPDLVTVRLAGTRRRYPLDAASVYRWGVAGAVEAARRAKAKARKDRARTA